MSRRDGRTPTPHVLPVVAQVDALAAARHIDPLIGLPVEVSEEVPRDPIEPEVVIHPPRALREKFRPHELQLERFDRYGAIALPGLHHTNQRPQVAICRLIHRFDMAGLGGRVRFLVAASIVRVTDPVAAVLQQKSGNNFHVVAAEIHKNDLPVAAHISIRVSLGEYALHFLQQC